MSYSNNLLEHLFGAKAKILKLFFQHPHLVLPVDEISKKASINKREGKRWVTEFVRVGILKKVNSNGKKAKKNIKK